MEKGKNGSIYHLSPDKGIAVRDVVRAICDSMEKNFDKSVRNVSERLGQDRAYIIDSTRAREELGWKTDISFEDGVQGVVRWVEEYWEDIQTQPLEYIHKP